MQWEDLAVSWTVKVDNIDDLYISKLKENLSNVQGFGWQELGGCVAVLRG